MDLIDPQLAIAGGRPVFPAGPPRWPTPNEAIRAALEAAYRDGAWGQYSGPLREQLEARLAQLTGRQFAWSCCSGTFAVELALRALKIDAGDEVILAGYDFGGNFRAIEAVGARPVLTDIDARTWTLSAESFAAAIGPETRAAIVSHLHGGTAPIAEIAAIAKERGVALIEDACQCPGAVIGGRPAGSWGEIGVLSFGGSKLLACGRGGAIVTNDPAILQRAKIYCDRGNDAFALSELQASVLLPQLDILPQQNATRSEAVQRLLATAERWHGLRSIQSAAKGDQPAYYKLAFDWQSEKASREQLICAAQAEGIALDAGFRGFARRPVSRCRVVGTLQNSIRASTNTVLLHHPILLGERPDIDHLAAGLAKLCEALAGN